MIVTYRQDGWQIITQRAHGILAAQIGFQWKIKEQPERWCETILAIAEHDDAEVELSGELLITETGGPLDFSMKPFNLSHCERLARLTATKSRYIALLTSLHMEFLYCKMAVKNKEARLFLQQQKKLRNKIARDIGLPRKKYLEIYSILEWCDALSLLLCKNQLQPEQRSMEVSTGPDRKKYNLTQMEDGGLSVQPWPFESSTFEVSVESRNIPKIEFSDSSDFRAEFQKAKVSELVWKFRNLPSAHSSPRKIKNRIRKTTG